MKNRSGIWLFLALVFILPAMAYAVVNWYQVHYARLPVMGAVTRENGVKKYHTIGDFSLENQDGRMVSLSDWKGRIMVVNFFFTHCPVVCPEMTKNLQRVSKAFTGDDYVRINSFSVDPERDSAAQLKRFAERWGIESPGWQLLTGDKKEIYRLARNSFLLVATDGDGGPDDFIHSEKLVLIDTKKRIRGFYSGTDVKEVEQLIIDIKKLKNEN